MLNKPIWRNRFSDFGVISSGLADWFDRTARPTSVPQGTEIFGRNKPVDRLFLLMSGTIHVQRGPKSGRTPPPYRIVAGDGGELLAACLLVFVDFRAECIAETEIEAMAIPRKAFVEMMVISTELRGLVFGTYCARMAELLEQLRPSPGPAADPSDGAVSGPVSGRYRFH